MGMRPERAAIRIFCCRGSCVVGLRMWDVWRGCDLSARMWFVGADVGHSGGCRQCDCTQGAFRRLSAVRLYARSIPAAVGSAIVRKGVSP